MTVGEDFMDEEIRRVEGIIGGMTLNELLYGGPKGPGLSTNITMLKDTVCSLAVTVAELSKNLHDVINEVNGSEGLRSSMRDIRREMQEFKEKADKAESLAWRAIWSLALIGLGTMVVDGKILYAMFSGGLK